MNRLGGGANVLAGMDYINKRGREGAQRYDSRLAGLAMGGDQSALGQLSTRDPASAMKVQEYGQGQEDRQRTLLTNSSRFLVGAPAGMQQQIWNSQIAPQLRTQGLDVDDWTDDASGEDIIKTAQALAAVQTGNSAGMQEFGALTSGMSAQDVERARRIKLGLDPRAVTGSRKTGTIKGADGRDRPYVFDPSSNTYQVFDGMGWRDMSPGEAQQAESAPQAQSAPPPGLYNTPNGQARIETDLSPAQWQAVQADMANGGQADQYQLPPRDVPPTQFYAGQPQQQPRPQPQGGALPPRYDYQAGGLLVGQSPAEQAGLSEEAKLRAQLQYAPQVAQAEAHAAQLKAQAESAGKPTKAQEAVDSQYGKDYVEFISGGAADANKALSELDAVIKQLEEGANLTGPVLGAMPKFLKDRFAAEASAAQETVESTVQRSLRVILGAQFTEKEGERLIARAYNPSLPESENLTRVKRLFQQLQEGFENKAAAARYYEENGTLRGFTGKLPSWGDFGVDSVSPAGREARPQQSGGVDDLLNKYGVR